MKTDIYSYTVERRKQIISVSHFHRKLLLKQKELIDIKVSILSTIIFNLALPRICSSLAGDLWCEITSEPFTKDNSPQRACCKMPACVFVTVGSSESLFAWSKPVLAWESPADMMYRRILPASWSKGCPNLSLPSAVFWKTAVCACPGCGLTSVLKWQGHVHVCSRAHTGTSRLS